MPRLIATLMAVALAMTALGIQTSDDQAKPAARVLVFSKTSGFRHDSIPAGVKAIAELGRTHGFGVEATEDAGVFSAESLSRFAVVVFLNTTGDVLDEPQQGAFEAYIKGGGGFVGVHAAADTEHGWEWYGSLVGARFKDHPAVQEATIVVHDRTHPSTVHLPPRWQRTDEWYNFDSNPRERSGNAVTVLASVDENSYAGGAMGQDHPIAWCHASLGGRAWYTALGHTIDSYSEPGFLNHLLGGIQWAGQISGKPEQR